MPPTPTRHLHPNRPKTRKQRHPTTTTSPGPCPTLRALALPSQTRPTTPARSALQRCHPTSPPRRFRRRVGHHVSHRPYRPTVTYPSGLMDARPLQRQEPPSTEHSAARTSANPPSRRVNSTTSSVGPQIPSPPRQKSNEWHHPNGNPRNPIAPPQRRARCQRTRGVAANESSRSAAPNSTNPLRPVNRWYLRTTHWAMRPRQHPRPGPPQAHPPGPHSRSGQITRAARRDYRRPGCVEPVDCAEHPWQSSFRNSQFDNLIAMESGKSA